MSIHQAENIKLEFYEYPISGGNFQILHQMLKKYLAAEQLVFLALIAPLRLHILHQ